jgi:tRNA U34 5-carboxymethylaminomethyl modifying GTPase MnmE/TrmE
MQLDVSAEVILSQLGYSKSEASLQQAEKIIGLTSNFDKFSKHIFTLNDHLKKMNAYVGLSNKSDYLKIKCDENDSNEILEEFHNEVSHWADKYNVKLQKLDDKHIYYILGTH